jgi:hypothetical protein
VQLTEVHVDTADDGDPALTFIVGAIVDNHVGCHDVQVDQSPYVAGTGAVVAPVAIARRILRVRILSFVNVGRGIIYLNRDFTPRGLQFHMTS